MVEVALAESGLRMGDIDAVAVTAEPGQVLALKIGVMKAIQLCKLYGLPLVKVHHMRAHALTARLIDRNLSFPFLSLLMSGGHCLLVLCRDVDDFLILGQASSKAPGECLDKVARELRLNKRPEFLNVHGGQAVEIMAERYFNSQPAGQEKVPPPAFDDFSSSKQYSAPDCYFQFHNIKSRCFQIIREKMHAPDFSAEAFCAWVQSVLLTHISTRLIRCMQILSSCPEAFLSTAGQVESFSKSKTLVLSGGVARNKYFCSHLAQLARTYDYSVTVPSPEMCSDNGAMVAWTGVEILNSAGGISNSKELPCIISHSKEEPPCIIANKPPCIISADNIPDMCYVRPTVPIGADVSKVIAQMQWQIDN